MRYYIIAGEASGDLHGSNLIKELHKKDKAANIQCWGGDMMQASGAKLVKHYRELAFMGFTEVIKNLPTILQNLTFCKKDIIEFKPDVIILIDYPGFNLRIAKWAKTLGFKIVYYISPQVWAWKENRVHDIKKNVDKMLVILPFEKDFYKKWNYEVEYVGHPLAEVVNHFKEKNKDLSNPFTEKKIIALLPGSRQQEIVKKLPIMLSVAKYFSEYQFIVAKAPGLENSFYDEMMLGYDNVSTVSNRTYELLMYASAALVTSGTATLETALFGVPEIICYKGNNISYQIAKRLITIKFIGLVNLIMNKEVVKELIQNELNLNNIKQELNLILHDTNRKEKIKKDYAALQKLLSSGGNASENAANVVIQLLN